MLVRKGLEEDLQLVLPEFLLAGLVQEGEVADMVDEDVAQDREFGVDGGDLSVFGFEGGAEAVQGGWGVEFGDFGADLVGDEFAFEVVFLSPRQDLPWGWWCALRRWCRGLGMPADRLALQHRLSFLVLHVGDGDFNTLNHTRLSLYKE